MSRFTRCLWLALFVIVAASAARGSQSTDGAFTTLTSAELEARHVANIQPWIRPERFQAVELDALAFTRRLEAAPPESAAAPRGQPLVLELPTPDGGFEHFAVFESPVMAAGLETWMAQQGWPMKTYAGTSLDHEATSVRLDWGGPAGLHASVLAPDRSYYIDPYVQGDREVYVSYYKRDYLAHGKQFACQLSPDQPRPRPVKTFAPGTPAELGPGTGGNLRKYRLVVAATGEYTAFHGGTKPLAQAAIVTTVNRINQVYERDLAIRMVLVANNQDVVYTNPATDPYTDGDGDALNEENQDNLDTVIGTANYDIGHVVGTGGGGLAGIGVVCDADRKAQGWTGSDSPIGDPFDIDFVAHEIGHQWGGDHTFNSTSGSCGGGTRNAATAYEPGSGSTIQAYAGICDPNNLQDHSDAYFHGVSLDQMLTHAAGDGACSVNVSAGNPNAPTVDAGANVTIPIGTPFELSAASSGDADGDTLTFAWEEFDLGPALALSTPDNGSSPIFRSWAPSTSSLRVFPRLQDLLAGVIAPGEKLPTTSRTMTFRLTVRDNDVGGGRLGEDTMTVTSTTGSGPFAVTFPNGGENITGAQTVTWSVAGTSGGSVSAANVDILLSTDGGLTYPTVLAAATPNDGSQSVTLPAVSTSTARVKVKGTGKVFFDVSNANFLIDVLVSCRTPALSLADPGSVFDDMAVAATNGIADLNLVLDVSHTWVGDLTITLTHVPAATSVVAIDRPGVPASGDGCDRNDIDATLDDEASQAVEGQCAAATPTIAGTFTPSNPLSAFDGQSLSGTWRLTVADAVGSDTGTLNEWCIVAHKSAGAIFSDGFESGNTSAWSSTVP